MYERDSQVLGAVSISLDMAAELVNEADVTWENTVFFAVINNSHGRISSPGGQEKALALPSYIIFGWQT